MTNRSAGAGRPTAGDVYLAAVEKWMGHIQTCEVDDCRECDARINQMRLARKVWQSSRHQQVTT